MLVTAKVQVQQLPVSNSNVCHLTVHIIFGFDQFSPVNFASICFTGDNMSFSFMKHFDGNTDRHFAYLILRYYLMMIKISHDSSNRQLKLARKIKFWSPKLKSLLKPTHRKRSRLLPSLVIVVVGGNWQKMELNSLMNFSSNSSLYSTNFYVKMKWTVK